MSLKVFDQKILEKRVENRFLPNPFFRQKSHSPLAMMGMTGATLLCCVKLFIVLFSKYSGA